MKSAPGVLIIDDDTSVQRILSSALADQYQVQVASTGEEGLRHYEQVRPDVVLLDLMLPEMSGYAVLRALRKKSTSTPVIMMTGVLVLFFLRARSTESPLISGSIRSSSTTSGRTCS